MTRGPREGEAHVSEYGLAVSGTELSLSERGRLIQQRGALRSVPVRSLETANAIVSRDLVEEYMRDEEWHARRIDVVDTGSALVVIDGHHRLAAAAARGARAVAAEVRDAGSGFDLS